MTRYEAVQRFISLGQGHLQLEGSQPGSAHDPDLRRFRERVMANPKAFLAEAKERGLARKEEVMSRREDLARQLAVLEGPGDLFGPLDHIRAEVLHTRAIAWVLSPWRLKRGIGHAGLGAFLGMLQRHEPEINVEWAAAATDQDCTIPEYVAGERGRVDVWLDLPHVLIAIEAKIDANERADQLKDYRAAVTSARKKRPGHTVFLGLQRPDKCSDHRAIRVGFKDLLRALLPVAAAGDDHDHHYLGLYLRTVARSLLHLSDTGTFETWDPARMTRTLTFLEESP